MELELKSTFNRIHDTRLVISDLTNQIVITHAAEPTEMPEDHQSIPVESALVPKDALTLQRQGMYWIVADFHPDLRLTVDRKSVTQGTPLPANGVLHVHSNVAGKAIFNLEFRKEVPPAPSNVRRYPIGKKLQIGRAELGRVGLNLNHPTVSRLHAEIISRNNRHQILDCSSEQGVYVNEKRVKRHVLHGGDVIRISAYTFRYKDGALFGLTAPREMNGTESPALQLVKFEQSGRLKSLTFEVYQQELVAILGPSGSGKSTLNESIIYRGGGTGGALFVMNTPIHKSKLGSILGYVPQQEVLHQSLTARECVHYYARLRLPEDTDNEEMRRNVAEALSAVRLTDRNQSGIPHCDTPITKLSGGQKKRVNIAMELVSKPQIFLLDEPTSGLDPLLDQEFMDLLYRLKTEQKVSILVTTHSTENIAKTCDKVLILAEGGYQAFFGTPHDSFEFFEAKLNDYVAIFKNLVATENNFAPIETLAKRFFGSEYHRPKPVPRSRLGSSNEEPLTIEIPSSKAVLQFLVRFAHQLRWQIIRDFHLKRLERPLGFGIIVVLSTLILRIVSFERFDVVANQPGSRIDLQTQAFLYAFLCVLFGVVYSVKDIIGERKILEREKLYRVNVFAYVAAKAITNGLLGLPIVLVASGILFLTGSLTDQNQFLPLFVFGSMVFFASSNTSLAISAIPFGSIEKTLYIAFFLILLQIILSGVIIPDINRAVSWFFLANWGTIAAADLVEIDRFCQKWKDACGNSLYSNYNSVQEIWRYLVMAFFPLGVAYILCKLTFRERK